MYLFTYIYIERDICAFGRCLLSSSWRARTAGTHTLGLKLWEKREELIEP